MSLTAAEQRVIDAIDTEALIALIDTLVAIPSLDGSPEEVAVQRAAATWMRQAGFATDEWEIDMNALARHPSYSAEVDRPLAIGVAGTIGEARGGKNLIFNGHVDVVPPGDLTLWRYDPWRATVEDGRVYGRGALDMKGGVACALIAMEAIARSGLRLRGTVTMQTVIGEEDGGCGTLAAVVRGYRADAAIIPEPTELKIAPAQAGVMNFRLTIPGLAAHGCVREEGVSAIEKFYIVYQALMRLERRRNDRSADPLYARYSLPYALCIGNVHAGTWASSVAESLTAEGRYGYPFGEDPLAARAEFEAAVAEAAAADEWLNDHAPVVEWWGGQFAAARTPEGHPIIETVAAAFGSITGQQPPLEGMTYGADMRLLANDGGIPTLMFGPGDVRVAHKADEYVPLADLEFCARTLALTALRFCGYDDEAA